MKMIPRPHHPPPNASPEEVARFAFALEKYIKSLVEGIVGRAISEKEMREGILLAVDKMHPAAKLVLLHSAMGDEESALAVAKKLQASGAEE